MDADRFKAAMRHVAASVCIITTTGSDAERYGCTATAVCSLSAEPASLLCCLNHASNSYQAITDARMFCVNVLAIGHDSLAGWFAANRPGTEKFSIGEWRAGHRGMPVLATAAAAFECILEKVVDAGTHGILIGHVVDVSIAGTEPKSLLYARGGYGHFAAISSSLEAQIGKEGSQSG